MRKTPVPFDDLQTFLFRLETLGQLKRIAALCDPVMEIPEIAGRVVREEGPALLFERVKGSPYPLAINVLASARRIELALGRHPQRIGEDLLDLAERISQPTPQRLWAERGRLWSLRSMRTTTARRARSQEVEEAPILTDLPTLGCWPKDGGRFITLPLVLTADPATGRRNLGTYRMQVYDEATTGMHWQIQKGGRFHYEAAQATAQPLEVAVAIGADPALILASIAPLPENVDELAFAGLLRGQPTRLARARTSDMLVPANAEFVLEGSVAPGERRLEGPFGDHFGHYSLAAPFPVFRVKRITRRRNPIYLASLVGKPPQEDNCLGDAVQQITAPLVRLLQPEVRSLWAYAAAGFHNLLVVSTKVRYPCEAIKTALALLGQGQTALTKCVVLVDDDVDPRDFGAVLRAIRSHFDPRGDLTVIEQAPLDTLDFTSFRPHVGGKMIISATREPHQPPQPPAPGAVAITPSALLRRLRDRGAAVARARLLEGTMLVAVAEGGPHPGPLPEREGSEGQDAINRGPTALEARARTARGMGGCTSLAGTTGRLPLPGTWREAGYALGDGSATPARTALGAVMAEAAALGAPLAVVVSADVGLEDPNELIWGVFTRFDPGLDLMRCAPSVDGSEAPPVLGIDATWKDGYPEPVAMSEDIVALVSRRWKEYGL